MMQGEGGRGKGEVLPALHPIVERARKGAYPGLTLLVLFGSRARGDVHAGSDWDLGYIAERHFDPDALLAEVVEATGSDQVDLVDLGRAGGQVRFRAARDGQALLEAAPGAFERFWMDAVTFWCDVAPIVARGYEQVLARLPR